MPKRQQPKRKRHGQFLEYPSSGRVERPRCDSCGKVLYSSKHDARMSLTGQLKSKSMRVYPCPGKPGMYHSTKEWLNKRN
jgi:hypothetical protein